MKYPAKQIFERNRGNLARLHVIVFDEMNKNNCSLTTTTLFEASNTWTVGSL